MNKSPINKIIVFLYQFNSFNNQNMPEVYLFIFVLFTALYLSTRHCFKKNHLPKTRQFFSSFESIFSIFIWFTKRCIKNLIAPFSNIFWYWRAALWTQYIHDHWTFCISFNLFLFGSTSCINLKKIL